MGIIARIMGRMIDRVLDRFTADDAMSDHLDRMDQIAIAIKHQEVKLVEQLIAQWPDDATAWQKNWLEEHRPKP